MADAILAFRPSLLQQGGPVLKVRTFIKEWFLLQRVYSLELAD